jgi:hypothetical protein
VCMPTGSQLTGMALHAAQRYAKITDDIGRLQMCHLPPPAHISDVKLVVS